MLDRIHASLLMESTCSGARGEGRYIDAGFGKIAVKFLSPVGDIARWSVAVEHAQRGIADIGQLVEDLVRDVDGLPGVECHALFAEAHFAGAFDDEVDFFLLLVVPRHLPAVGLQGDVADGEIRGLDGAGAPDQVLRAAARGISASRDLGEIGDGHDVGSVRDQDTKWWGRRLLVDRRQKTIVCPTYNVRRRRAVAA